MLTDRFTVAMVSSLYGLHISWIVNKMVIKIIMYQSVYFAFLCEHSFSLVV